MTLRTEAVVELPEDMDPAEVAPLMCAGVTTFNSLRNMSAKPPQFVAIQGIGYVLLFSSPSLPRLTRLLNSGLGHLGIQFANAMGYRVVALSSSPAKAELARSLGAEIYIDGSKVNQAEALQQLGGANLIMCTAPNSEVIRGLLPGLAVNGELLILALTEDANIPLCASSCSYVSSWTVRLMKHGRVCSGADPEALGDPWVAVGHCGGQRGLCQVREGAWGEDHDHEVPAGQGEGGV